MSLTDRERNDIVAYRIERARQSYSEACSVFDMGMWSLAANRLYYALYYASAALLISRGYTTRTHSGMITQTSKVFVKEGVLSVDDIRLIKSLFDLRQECDYDDFIYLTGEELKPFMPRVGELLNKIAGLVKTSEN